MTIRVFKNKAFAKWAEKEGVSDGALLKALGEINKGLVDADLGAHVYKKRVAVGGKGKRGGVRTLIAYRMKDRAFFVYGFAKSKRSNIKDNELKVLKKYAETLLGFSHSDLDRAVRSGEFVEVKKDG